MGLLQRLFGRPADEPADGADAVADTTDAPEASPDESTDRPAPDGGVLGDAAPLPEVPEVPVTASPDPSPEPGEVPEPVAEAPHDTSADDSPGDTAEPETEPEQPVLFVTATSTDTDEAPLATVLPFRGGAVAEEPPSAPEAAEEREEQPKTPEFPDLFTPSRPRRELLTLDPPAAPEPEPAEEAVVEDLPIDASGSPRAALRSAGVAVPHMQLVTTRGSARLWAFPVAEQEALGWWLEIRRVHDRTGWLPVLLGPADGWLDDAESVLHEGDDELGRLSEVDVEELLRVKAAEAGEPPRGVATLPTRGDSTFTVAKAPGLLGLVQADHGWQIPALLPWAGSTNWEIFGAEHAAVLRRWDERVDVEVVAMSWDVLELYVAEPPAETADAVELAQEVYAYCPDLLAAGVPTLDDLAVHMVKSKAWYFRWND
ncbi:DUF4253 domain-containing protein [Phytomonospora endophytica]|uniref:DUF4253 domain-containing protein n=1 Tax=Phytomonospora endophytica TaxID=714109 RepID=A0A841FXG7_9ACTN|nr:DUF4253 domain-containing protein [Phytomonospora endophytica]MBB6038428.1 hypothetical protein [Phytomonospora endophytica]GIG64357.1 hypothetical protein Pen01_06520 [Phytomonospora endophytica]